MMKAQDPKFFIRHYLARVREVAEFFPNNILEIEGLSKLSDFMMYIDHEEFSRVVADNGLTLKPKYVFRKKDFSKLSGKSLKIPFETIKLRCVPSVQAFLTDFENETLNKGNI